MPLTQLKLWILDYIPPNAFYDPFFQLIASIEDDWGLIGSQGQKPRDRVRKASKVEFVAGALTKIEHALVIALIGYGRSRAPKVSQVR